MKSYGLKNKVTKLIDILKNPGTIEYATGSAMLLTPAILNNPSTGNYVADAILYTIAYGGGFVSLFDGGLRWVEYRDKGRLEKKIQSSANLDAIF